MSDDTSKKVTYFYHNLHGGVVIVINLNNQGSTNKWLTRACNIWSTYLA